MEKAFNFRETREQKSKIEGNKGTYTFKEQRTQKIEILISGIRENVDLFQGNKGTGMRLGGPQSTCY